MKRYIASLLTTSRGKLLLSIFLFILGFLLAIVFNGIAREEITAKALVGCVTVALSTCGLGHFLLDSLWGKSRPHVYSWLIWAVVNGIVWVNQWSHGAGPGAWSTLMMMILSGAIFVVALWQWKTGRADHDLTIMDQWCLGGAAVSIGFLIIFNTGPLSILAATITDVFAFASTFRKIWSYPQSEPASNYALNTIRQSIVIGVISSYNFVTLIFPLSLIVLNVMTVALIFVRNRQLNQERGAQGMNDLPELQG